MTDTYDDYERRVRERAHEIWVREGRPEGQAEAHWARAREEISEAEGIQDTLKPNPLVDPGPDAESLIAVEGMADLPGRLTDQGDRQDYPSRQPAPKKAKAAAKPKASAEKPAAKAEKPATAKKAPAKKKSA
jgi:hypothetical protein